MRPARSACAALSVWLGLQRQASAFIFPGVCNPKQPRQLDRQSTAVLLEGGGLEGGPAKPHHNTQTSEVQPADDDERNGEVSEGDHQGKVDSVDAKGSAGTVWRSAMCFFYHNGLLLSARCVCASWVGRLEVHLATSLARQRYRN